MIPAPTRSPRMSCPRDIIVVGASAGGLPPLLLALAGLPADFAAAVFVALHIPGDKPSGLARILDGAGGLRSSRLDGACQRIENGRIYVADPGCHLTVRPGRVSQTAGPKLRLFRPSIDLLFGSAASAFGPRVVGVVLSGLFDDGSAGLREIKRLGGTSIVQEPRDARFGDMPRNALRQGAPDFRSTGEDLGSLLLSLVPGPPAPTPLTRPPWMQVN